MGKNFAQWQIVLKILLNWINFFKVCPICYKAFHSTKWDAFVFYK
jgi:hypothetical protein